MIEQVEGVSERLNVKTLEQMFVSMVEKGYDCPPFVSNAILDTAKAVFMPDNNGSDIRPGQMVVIGVDAKEPAGKRLKDCELMQAVVTLDSGKEDEVVRAEYGLDELRRTRLARIANDAWEQGVLLTQEDLAYRILGCGIRTLRRDIVLLAERCIHVPTRGQQKDIGKGTSHSIQAVRLYMQRRSYTDIARELRHSLEAVKRYVLTFARVAFLADQSYHTRDIAFLVQVSSSLAERYRKLYAEYSAREEYSERLEEVIEFARPYQAKRGVKE